MQIFVSGATATVREYVGHPDLGVLLVPSAFNNPDVALDGHHSWAIDNGAFSDFNAERFLLLLEKTRGKPCCRFVACPDVVGDATVTRTRFDFWEPMIHSLGFPVALVAQDGLTVKDTPWMRLDALFIGGTTTFKLGHTARVLAAYAKARGKWLHMGRVNSRQRLHYAERIGCDSVDGTCFSRWGNVWIPKGLQWVEPLPLFRDLQAVEFLQARRISTGP